MAEKILVVDDEETDARKQLARMPFDLGQHPARLVPGAGLIVEGPIEPSHMVRRPADGALQQMCDPLKTAPSRVKPRTVPRSRAPLPAQRDGRGTATQ